MLFVNHSTLCITYKNRITELRNGKIVNLFSNYGPSFLRDLASGIRASELQKKKRKENRRHRRRE